VSKHRPRSLPASVRQRLLYQARTNREEFQFVLIRYALERLLYRLSCSPNRDLFVLKGAMLFRLWSGQLHRPTKDLDLLGQGEQSLARFEQIFRELCGQEVEDDGLVFDAASVWGEQIREDQEYEGLRIHCIARLERAKAPLQIDIGFGDAITPPPVAIEFPTLLDFPAPHLRAYPRETVVAEKYQAMVALGIANSRMKDFYDLWFLAHHFDFKGTTLSNAIRATFDRRRTPLPTETPLAWTPAFHDDGAKKQQWRAFGNRSKLSADGIGLSEIAAILRAFLLPPTAALRADESFGKSWPPGGPWR
jgi:predicted nucleotidyltransferase component of viral defense system